LAKLFFYMQMLLRVDQHDAVLIEQALIALHCDNKIAFIFEREPGSAVRQNIGIGRRSGIKRCAHALPYVFVPRTFLSRDVKTGKVPEIELCDVRAGAITSGNKRSLLFLDGFKGGNDVLGAFYACWIAFGTNK